MATQLPDAVNAGDEIEVQLAPRGAYPQIVDGKEVMQIVDDTAIKSLIDTFNAEKEEKKAKGENYQVLVDADHSSEVGSNTAAMAWVDRLFDDPDRGLVGVFVFTKEGADAVTGKKWRFISPAWTLTEDGHPEKLVSVGMTNKPNLPVSPMLNMRAVKNPNAGTVALNAGADGVTPKPDEANDASVGGKGEQKTEVTAPDGGITTIPKSAGNGEVTNQEGTENMEEIKSMLGLPAEATDEEVKQAIEALIVKCGGMEQVQNALGLEPTTTNEEVLAAVNAVLEQSEALQNADAELKVANEKLAEIEQAKLNAEAEELVKENEDVIPEESVEALKAEYVENPEAVKETVANMRKVYERAVINSQKKVATKKVAINFREAQRPVAINMETMLADCGGDPAKENEKLKAMSAKA